MNHTQGEVEARGDNVTRGGRHTVNYFLRTVDTHILLLEMEPTVSCSHEGELPDTEREANINRIATLWNAANGMPTEEAVSLLNGTHLAH